MDWNAFEVDVASDGQHIVRWRPEPFRYNYDELALAFYRNGKEIKRYTVQDMVRSPTLLPQTVGHYWWLEIEHFNDATNRLSIETITAERYIFDVRTGEISDAILPIQLATSRHGFSLRLPSVR